MRKDIYYDTQRLLKHIQRPVAESLPKFKIQPRKFINRK